MVYVRYSADIKFLAVRLRKEGKSVDEIQSHLKNNVSRRSIKRWVKLYDETRSVIRDPATYHTRGPPTLLTRAQAALFLEIIDLDPTLFLDELQEEIWRRTGEWPSLSTVQTEVVHRLGLTLKIGRRVHALKDPEAQAEFSLRIAAYPRRFLLFGDESAVTERALHRKKARSPRGLRSIIRLPKIQGKRYSVLPIVSENGVVTVLVKEGSVSRKEFTRFLRKSLVRTHFLSDL